MESISIEIKKTELINEIAQLGKHNKRIHGIMVLQNDTILLDEVFNGYDKDSNHNLFSVTKSVISLLIGIAVEKGYINSVEDKVIDLIPNYINHITNDKKDLKLKHLLNMRTGLKWDELTHFGRNDGLWNQFLKSTDPGAFVLKQPLETQVDKVYNYNSGVSHLLSLIIEDNCPCSTFEFAQKELFGPLEINLENEQWTRDINNVVYGGHGLHLKMKDLMKIGKLILENGTYNNKQILSKTWLEESFKAYSEMTRGYEGYGYQWWLGNVSGIPFAGAFGHGGQRLYLFKKMNLGIVFLGNVKPEFGIQERLIRKYMMNSNDV